MEFSEYGKIFTPSAPVLDSFLVGRRQDLFDLQNALSRPGMNPIVIGHRGVGKTTLVENAIRTWRGPIIRFSSSPSATFQDLVRFAKSQIDGQGAIDQQEIVSSTSMGGGASLGVFSGKGSASIEQTDTLKPIQHSESLPFTLFTLLTKDKHPRLLIVDEYDATKSQAKTFHEGIAYTIKHLSDNCRRTDSRVLIIGISQSAENLLGRHESIERCAIETYVLPLKKHHVVEFLAQAEEHLGFKFDDPVRQRIVDHSLGYPYFMHLVGLNCLDAMTYRDSRARRVTMIDYSQAIDKAVNKAFRSTLSKYKVAIQGLSPHEIDVIRALALHPKMNPPRHQFRAMVVGDRIMKANDVDQYLTRLQQEKGLLYISRNDDTVRFSDPLMKPFLRAKFCGLREAELHDQPDLFDSV